MSKPLLVGSPWVAECNQAITDFDVMFPYPFYSFSCLAFISEQALIVFNIKNLRKSCLLQC